MCWTVFGVGTVLPQDRGLLQPLCVPRPYLDDSRCIERQMQVFLRPTELVS